MDRLQEISNYINNVKIKKTLFGGFDREDVYVKFQELLELFQKCLEEEQENQKKLLDEYEFRMETSQMLVTELNKKLGTLSVEQRNVEQEKEKMKEVYKEYCSNILQQYSDSLRTLSVEFSQILNNITNLQKNIIETEIFEGFEDKIEVKEVNKISENEIGEDFEEENPVKSEETEV